MARNTISNLTWFDPFRSKFKNILAICSCLFVFERLFSFLMFFGAWRTQDQSHSSSRFAIRTGQAMVKRALRWYYRREICNVKNSVRIFDFFFKSCTSSFVSLYALLTPKAAWVNPTEKFQDLEFLFVDTELVCSLRFYSQFSHSSEKKRFALNFLPYGNASFALF